MSGRFLFMPSCTLALRPGNGELQRLMAGAVHVMKSCRVGPGSNPGSATFQLCHMDKSFNLSLERDRGCQSSLYLATFCHRILNSRRQVRKERGHGIQTRVLILMWPRVCMTSIMSFHL